MVCDVDVAVVKKDIDVDPLHVGDDLIVFVFKLVTDAVHFKRQRQCGGHWRGGDEYGTGPRPYFFF